MGVDGNVVGSEEASTMFGGKGFPDYIVIKSVYFGNRFVHYDEDGDVTWVDYFDREGHIFRVWND